MMRTILCYALAASLAALAYGADGTTPAKKSTAKKAPAQASATKAPAKPPAKASAKTPVRRPATTTASRKTGKKAAPATTWRNRQVVPTPERYKEIQDALVAKGYLKPEDVGGGWNQNSMDALKRFQGEQSIEASGKINSLSLIALGLGPKHDSNPTRPPDPGSNQDR